MPASSALTIKFWTHLLHAMKKSGVAEHGVTICNVSMERNAKLVMDKSPWQSKECIKWKHVTAHVILSPMDSVRTSAIAVAPKAALASRELALA